jgi:deazaflavin-dependent oxidoreductase (nitroreductase family)
MREADMRTHTQDPVALIRNGQIIDFTTTGRRSGEAKRIEINIFSFDGRLYISGSPGPRAWLANVASDPRLIVHLKTDVVAVLPGRARVISDPDERRPLLERITRHWRRESDLEAFVASSPLIEVLLEEAVVA